MVKRIVNKKDLFTPTKIIPPDYLIKQIKPLGDFRFDEGNKFDNSLNPIDFRKAFRAVRSAAARVASVAKSAASKAISTVTSKARSVGATAASVAKSTASKMASDVRKGISSVTSATESISKSASASTSKATSDIREAASAATQKATETVSKAVSTVQQKAIETASKIREAAQRAAAKLRAEEAAAAVARAQREAATRTRQYVEQATKSAQQGIETITKKVGGAVERGRESISRKVSGIIEPSSKVIYKYATIGDITPKIPDLSTPKTPEVMTDPTTGITTMSAYKAEDYDYMYSQSWLDAMKQAGKILIAGKWMDSRKWGTPEQVSIMAPFKTAGTTKISHYTDLQLKLAKEAGVDLPGASKELLEVWEPGVTESELNRKYTENIASRNPEYADYINMVSFQTGAYALGEDIQDNLLTKYGNEYQKEIDKLQRQVNEGEISLSDAQDKNKEFSEDTQKKYETEFNEKYKTDFNSLLKIQQKMDKDMRVVTTTGKEFAKYAPAVLEIGAIVAAPPLGVMALGTGKILYGGEAQDVSQVIGGAALVGLGGLGKMRALEREFVTTELVKHAKDPMLTDTLKIKGESYDIDLFKGIQKSGKLTTETTITGKIYSGKTPGTYYMPTGKGFQVTKGELGWNILSKGEGTHVLATKSFDIGGKGLIWTVDETGKVLQFAGKSTILPQSSTSVLYGTWGPRSVKQLVKSYELGGDPIFGKGTAGFAVKAKEDLYYTGSGKLGPESIRYDPFTGQQLPIRVKVQDLGRIQIIGGKKALEALGPTVEITGGGPSALGQVAIRALGPTARAVALTRPFTWMAPDVIPAVGAVVTGTKTITLGVAPPIPILKPEIIPPIVKPKEVVAPPVLKPVEGIKLGKKIESTQTSISKLKLLERQKLEQGLRLTQTQRLRLETLTMQLNKLTLGQRLGLTTLQIQRLTLSQIQRLRMEPIFVFKPITPIRPAIPITPIKLVPPVWLPKIEVVERVVKPVKKVVKKVKGFMPYGKHRGRWKKLSRLPMSLIDSKNRAAFAVDTSTSASFQIKPMTNKKLGKVKGKEKGYYERTKHKFRQFRKKGKRKVPLEDFGHIELKGKRMDTPEEVEKLHLARLIKQKKWLVEPKRKRKVPKKRLTQIKWF